MKKRIKVKINNDRIDIESFQFTKRFAYTIANSPRWLVSADTWHLVELTPDGFRRTEVPVTAIAIDPASQG